MRNFAASIASYKSALALNSTLASSLYGLGLAYQASGKTAAAAANMAAAKRVDTNIANEFGK